MTPGILSVPSLPDAARIVLAAPVSAQQTLLEESAGFGNLEFDFATGILHWSANTFRLYGFEPGAGICLGDVRARVHPDDRHGLQRAIAESLRTSGRYSTVSRIHLPDGTTVWRQLRACVEVAADGAPLRLLGTIIDITALKNAEFARDTTLNQVFTLIDGVSELFLVLDRELRFTWVNQRVLERAGRMRADVLGKSVEEIFPSAGDDSLSEGYRQVREGRCPCSFQASCRVADGQEAWFEVDAYPTPDGMASFLREVTELKKTRQALRESDERFRRAQQAANIGAFEWDVATGEVTWIAKVPTFIDIVPDDNFQTYVDFVVEEDRQLFLDAVRRLYGGGQHSVEIRFRHPDGRIPWLLIKAEAFFDEAGKPTHVYGVAMDITDRKLAEQALRMTEKLAATGRLAATVAHEINNPLEAVTNLLFLASHSMEAGSEPWQYLKTAEDELERVATMVRQTLGFYRGSTSPAETELNVVVQDTLRIFEKRFLTKSIHVIAEVDEQVKIFAIEGEIRQIIVNLLNNAHDAVSSNGSVTVRVWQRSGRAHLEVRDDGPGIAAAVMPRLFEAFFTAGKSTGTGLGLWVSRDLAKKNGGCIEVQTWTEGEGHGSSFVLTLPLHSAVRGQLQ
jgi:PAS domain S-box-containing protein